MPNSWEEYETYKYSMYTNCFLGDDSRWATDFEMKNSLKEINISNESYPYGGIPLISDGNTVYVDQSDSHSIIFGATGSKKTRLFCMPELEVLSGAGESFIVTDPKGELYDRISGRLHEMDYNVFVLNIREPTKGDSWNPLSLPLKFYREGKKDEAIELLNDFANSITPGKAEDPYWDSSAQQFCRGLLMILLECAKDSEVNIKSLISLRSQIMADSCEGGLVYLHSNINQQTLAYQNLMGTVCAADKTRASILSVFDSFMQPFITQKNLVEMLAESSFDLEEIGLKKTAVFIIMPDEKNTYHFLVTLFVKQCYETLIKIAQTQQDKLLPIRTNFILDEFANIPPIPDMPSMITAARSRNIRFTLVVQSEHQLQNQYGANAQTIKGNCDNWIFLTSRELPLLQEISELCGTRQVVNSTNQLYQIPLISVSQLQRLDKEKGEALIFHGRQYPYLSRLADIDNYAFRKYSSIPLAENKRKLADVFDLVEYMNRTDVDLSKLFRDEFAQKEPDESDIDEMSEEELEKRFDELFTID